MAKKGQTAKNRYVKKEIDTFPFEHAYIKWLKSEKDSSKGLKERTALSYANRIKRLNKEVFRQIAPQGKSILDFIEITDKDALIYIVSRYLEIVYFSKDNFGIPKDSYGDCKTALTKYIEFLYKGKRSVKIPEYIEITNFIEPKFANASVVFPKKFLLENFIWRLTTQDRTTGNKVWFPIRVVRFLFTHFPELEETNNSTSPNYANVWAKECAKTIDIFVVGSCKPIKLNLIDSLMINPENGEVKITIKGNTRERFIVCHPGGDEPLRANWLNDIHIDHKDAIDKLLRYDTEYSIAKDLKAFPILTEWLKEAKSNNLSDINNFILNKCANRMPQIKNDLIDDLILIKNNQQLQLMEGKKNRKKSNK